MARSAAAVERAQVMAPARGAIEQRRDKPFEATKPEVITLGPGGRLEKSVHPLKFPTSNYTTSNDQPISITSKVAEIRVPCDPCLVSVKSVL